MLLRDGMTRAVACICFLLAASCFLCYFCYFVSAGKVLLLCLGCFTFAVVYAPFWLHLITFNSESKKRQCDQSNDAYNNKVKLLPVPPSSTTVVQLVSFTGAAVERLRVRTSTRRRRHTSAHMRQARKFQASLGADCFESQGAV